LRIFPLKITVQTFDKSNVKATSVQVNDSMLHLPSAEAAGARRSVPCAIAEIHGHYLRIVTSEPVKPGAAISVEGADAMFLGEVVRSSEEEGRWRLDVRVEQILNGLMSLMALRARLLDGATQAAPVHQATSVREPASAAQVRERSFAS
jgi:hypothetical protein